MKTISMLIASNKNWTLAQQKNLEKIILILREKKFYKVP